jgi:hypothetical protein
VVQGFEISKLLPTPSKISVIYADSIPGYDNNESNVL